MTAVHRLIALGLCISVIAADAEAYEILTHQDLTEAAVDRSVLGLDPNILKNLGLERGIRDRAQEFPNSKGQEQRILDLLRDGAEFEDNVSLLPPEVRVRFHFYNPVTGEGLSRPPFIPVQTSSPDWALAPRRSISGQEFSYQDARQYLLDALTKQGKTDREMAFGLAFQTLGHVVHHLQDMAQPQHVRNDVHCDKLICVPLNAHAPSFFETWTNQADILNSIAQRDTNPASIDYNITGAAFTSVFNSPRKFWSTEAVGAVTPAGKGIAEFTNRNFLSAGTNFDNPQQPSPQFFALPAFDPARKTEPTVAELCNNTNLTPPCPSSMTAFPQARITFYETTGHDNFLNTPVTNPRASTESIFDEQLRVQGEQRVFALNRFNFDEAYKHLIPRAVAYSAGLINYFFRGKLDFKKDEQDSTKFRVVNLGPEAMNGRFALYYDAVDGNRYPVAVDPADPNRDGPEAWRLTIAALDPAVANSNLSMPVSFIAPANDGSPQSPKVANEYILVFSGNMGAELEDEANGVLGAVVAKSIATPYNGALYLLGVDAAGQRVSLRADKSGTRVVGPGEFDPLRGITIPSHLQTLSKGYVVKQVAFTEHLFGFSYDVLAATVGIHFPFFGAFATGWVKNSATNAFEIVSGVAWTAKSPDPLIGEFRFRPIVPANNPAAATLGYRRTYQDAAGNPQTFTGTIALPPIPGNQMNYQVFPQGLVFISGDGLRVSGFQKALQISSGSSFTVTVEDYELRISLAEIPSVAFVKTGERPSFASTTISQPSQTVITGTVSTAVACDPPPNTITGNVTSTTYLHDHTTSLDETHFIEYLNGALRTYRRTENGRSLVSGQRTGASMAGGRACSWIYLQTKGATVETLRVDGQAVFSDGALVTEIRGNLVFGGSRPEFSGLGASNRTWDYFYEGLAPAPPIQFVPTPAPVSTRQYFVDQALTDRVDDAIFTLQSGTSADVTMFRTHDITGKWFVADASPLGEVFFATADLRIVVHDPKPGIPKLVIPPNVVRLLAAVWL